MYQSYPPRAEILAIILTLLESPANRYNPLYHDRFSGNKVGGEPAYGGQVHKLRRPTRNGSFFVSVQAPPSGCLTLSHSKGGENANDYWILSAPDLDQPSKDGDGWPSRSAWMARVSQSRRSIHLFRAVPTRVTACSWRPLRVLHTGRWRLEQQQRASRPFSPAAAQRLAPGTAWPVA